MTLTETVFWTKIVSKYFIIGIVIFVSGYFVIKFINPSGSDAVFIPVKKCGQITTPKLVSQKDASIANATINVKALGSALPDSNVPELAYVYKIDVRGETFQTRDYARLLAKNFDFDEEIVTHEPGSTTYEWNNMKNRTTLIFDTATDNFTFYKAIQLLPKAPNLELPSTLFKAPEFAINYLTALGVYNKEFQDGKVFSYPVTMQGGVPFTAKSLDDAQLLRIDFQKVTPLLYYPTAIRSRFYEGERNIDFTKMVEIVNNTNTSRDKDQYTMLTARRVGQTPETANVQLYMNSQMTNPSNGIYQLIYKNWKIEEVPCGAYSMIKPSEVIRRIEQGEGNIVFLMPLGGDKLNPVSVEPVTEVNLYNMEVAYYESDTVQDFLQPIYVVTGQVVFQNGVKGEIAIYFPALRYD